MSILSTLALIALSLVGYSAGATLAGRGQKLSPTLFDLGAVFGIWTTAVLLRGDVGRWLSILVWLLVAGLVSAGFTVLRGGRRAKAEARRTSVGTLQMSTFRRAWRTWKTFAIEMGNYQGRVLMAFFYFAVVTPFGLVLRLFGDPLNIRTVPEQSSWVERADADTSIEEARGQS